VGNSVLLSYFPDNDSVKPFYSFILYIVIPFKDASIALMMAWMYYFQGTVRADPKEDESSEKPNFTNLLEGDPIEGEDNRRSQTEVRESSEEYATLRKDPTMKSEEKRAKKKNNSIFYKSVNCCDSENMAANEQTEEDEKLDDNESS